MNAMDSEGLSALHRAVRVNDVSTVVSLLDNAAADINLKGRSGLTPLHAAVRYVHVLNDSFFYKIKKYTMRAVIGSNPFTITLTMET